MQTADGNMLERISKKSRKGHRPVQVQRRLPSNATRLGPALDNQPTDSNFYELHNNNILSLGEYKMKILKRKQLVLGIEKADG